MIYRYENNISIKTRRTLRKSMEKTNLSIARLTKFIVLSLFLFSVVSLVSAAGASEFQSLQSLRMQAEDFILQYAYKSPYPPRFDVGNIDSRLRLKACPVPLHIEYARHDKIHGNTALNVSCQQGASWKLLLPVRIELFDDVLVLARALHKGQIIDGNQVKHQKQNVTRLNNGYYSKDDELSGLEAARNLKRGTILTPASLRPREMVKSGQQVTLILEYKGLQIKSTGKALQSAHWGEVIKVRNNQSNRVVEGFVSGVAQVQVNL